MPKRALIFSFVYYPRFIGGAEIAIKEITDRISQNEIEFHLIALRKDKDLPETEKIGNVIVHRLGSNKYLYPFFAVAKALRLHKEKPFNFTWSMMANYSGFGALFFKFFHNKVPFLLTLQEGDPIPYIKKRVRFVYPLFKMIFTRATFIQTISRYLANFANEMGAKCPVVVIPNGVDLKHFTEEYSETELQNLKKELDKDSDDIFLITTSRLVVKNAVCDIVSALSYLPENVKLLILGTGYELEPLKKLSRNLDLEERVKFLGFVAHKDMPKYLRVSEIFIRPSISEGFGNSFIEAMATGIPVIATPVGGIVDFLKNKETGLFCEVSAPEDIARKVEIYLRDVNLRNEIIDNAKKMVEEKYGWNLVAKNMKEEVFDIMKA